MWGGERVFLSERVRNQSIDLTLTLYILYLHISLVVYTASSCPVALLITWVRFDEGKATELEVGLNFTLELGFVTAPVIDLLRLGLVLLKSLLSPVLEYRSCPVVLSSHQ